MNSCKIEFVRIRAAESLVQFFCCKAKRILPQLHDSFMHLALWFRVGFQRLHREAQELGHSFLQLGSSTVRRRPE